MTAPAAEQPETETLKGQAIWSDAIYARPARLTGSRLMGILPGEGIGAEVVGAAMQVLDALEAVRPLGIRRITGGPIGLAAKESVDGAVTRETAQFCNQMFEEQGALF